MTSRGYELECRSRDAGTIGAHHEKNHHDYQDIAIHPFTIRGCDACRRQSNNHYHLFECRILDREGCRRKLSGPRAERLLEWRRTTELFTNSNQVRISRSRLDRQLIEHSWRHMDL